MLSVIITVFEQAASLEALLYCLRAQDILEPFEVVICDDGSSPDVFKAVACNDDFSSLDIRYIWQQKGGHRAARSKNNGIRCAKGEILVFLDGDILIPPDYLSKHIAAHTAPKQIVCNPRRWIAPYDSSSSAFREDRAQQSDECMRSIVARVKVSVSSLLAGLKDEIVDIDRPSQQKFARSAEPWMACIGFSFSVAKDARLYFDEAFEGWGPEDRELALRMVKLCGYTVSFREDIEVFHLEVCSTGRVAWSLLPRSHFQIVAYLKNMLYFNAAYPGENISDLMAPLISFRLNQSGQHWEFAPAATARKPTSAAIADKVRYVEAWFRTQK